MCRALWLAVVVTACVTMAAVTASACQKELLLSGQRLASVTYKQDPYVTSFFRFPIQQSGKLLKTSFLAFVDFRSDHLGGSTRPRAALLCLK